KIFGNPKSGTSPILASGQAYTNLVQNFFTKWQAGHVKDLASGLKSLDKQLDAQVKQAGGGGGGAPCDCGRPPRPGRQPEHRLQPRPRRSACERPLGAKLRGAADGSSCSS